MAPISVDSRILYNAAVLYEGAYHNADNVIKTLAAALDNDWGCAGSDSAGRTWADSYDPAAFKAIASGIDIVNAFGKLHDLLAFTAVNHANTEKLNKHPPETPDPAPAVLAATTAPLFKGAFGGDSDPPFGWSMISSWLQGHTWPNGDPDKLRRLGTAWRTAAKGLRDASAGTSQAWTNLEENASEELPQAIDQMDAVWMGAEAVATQYEKLGGACEDWAQQIEDAHQKILAILAGAIGVGLLAGVAVGFFTAGTGAVATTTATGSAAGAAVVTVLVAFDAAAAVAAGVTVAAGAAAIGVATDLQPLLEANPTQFDTSTSAGGGTNPSSYSRPPEVPSDWVPRTADNGKGVVWQKPGSTGNADTIRVMQPNSRYPNGYVRFYNSHGQPVDLAGKPGPKTTTHISINPDGTFPKPQGW
ncbi:hypothetical protein ACIHDR_03535 [Nocardia sp. NPDC052278]|uniref:WXG100-like domain-containing protein n=1 Tax=unclassified Nocardia TaxID=2637762 RepID=UPI0036A55E46